MSYPRIALPAAIIAALLALAGCGHPNQPQPPEPSDRYCFEPDTKLRDRLDDWYATSDLDNMKIDGDKDFCVIDEIDPGSYEVRARARIDNPGDAGFCAYSVGDWRDPEHPLTHGSLYQGEPPARVDVPARRGIALSLVHACEFRKVA